MPSTYEYSSLIQPSTSGQADSSIPIRILTLYPGVFSNEIEVALEFAEFRETKPPIYEALSYVWGSPDNPVRITIKTGKTSGTLFVTQNLAIALRHLRHAHKHRVLWIDAICINQSNLSERGQQVAKMGDIYRLASRVVIWLGTEADQSDLAMDSLRDLGSKIEIDWATMAVMPSQSGQSEPHWADLHRELPYEQPTVSAIEKLLERPWFERLWVIQEARLAGPSSIAMCGFKTTRWRALLDCLFLFSKKGLGPEIRTRLHEHAKNISTIFHLASTFGLAHLLSFVQDTKCADARDRVYAVLGIIPDYEKAWGITPDYNLTARHVYEDVVRRYVTNGDLQFLASCDLSTRRLSAPTWVPDWASPRSSSRILECYAADFVFSEAVFPESGVARVAGIRGPAISQVHEIPAMSQGDDWDVVIDAITKISPADVLTAEYTTGCSLLEAFCSTLSCSNFSDFDSHPASYLSLEASMDVVRGALRSADGDPRLLDSLDPRQVSSRLGRFISMAKGRSFFLSTEGPYMGLGPASAIEGDIICVLIGCSTPVVLRPIVGTSQFNVVGECFVPGLMKGEAVLGPLPENVRLIARYSERDGGWLSAFHDDKTGETSWEDPRQLSLGIDTKRNDDGITRLVRVGDLKRVGIDVQYFDLV